MSDGKELVAKKFGPAIVSLANAARAFDAPVRNPLLIKAPGFAFGGTNYLAMPRASAFVSLIEHFFGMLILTPIILYRRGFKQIFQTLKEFDRKDWFALIYVSMGGSALGLFFFLISLGMGNPTVAILLQKTQPLITLAFAAVILKEKPSWQYYVTLGISLIGVFLITFDELVKSGQSFNWVGLVAILCSLLAATMWGGSTVFGRRLTEKLNYWDLTFLRYVGGFFFLVVFNGILLTYNNTYFEYLFAGTYVSPGLYDVSDYMFLSNGIGVYPNVSNSNWPVIACIAYSAVLTGGVLPLALYYFGLKRSKATIAGLAELAFPLIAIFANYFFLGYELTNLQLVGAGILLLTVSMLSYVNAKEMAKAKEMEKVKGEKQEQETGKKLK
ncbi:MAG: DMT family transporter [Candidatus Heimdallarchaeota archaeon]|nr:DMT family transporter [Candidatus Heimdallarchaeota archaeon]